MKLQVTAHHSQLDPLDDRWLTQVHTLAEQLQNHCGKVDTITAKHPQRKGVEVGPVLLTLGSAGALSAALELVKSFVSRDRNRSVRLSWHRNGKLESLEISGSGAPIDESVIANLMQVAKVETE